MQWYKKGAGLTSYLDITQIKHVEEIVLTEYHISLDFNKIDEDYYRVKTKVTDSVKSFKHLTVCYLINRLMGQCISLINSVTILVWFL